MARLDENLPVSLDFAPTTDGMGNTDRGLGGPGLFGGLTARGYPYSRGIVQGWPRCAALVTLGSRWPVQS